MSSQPRERIPEVVLSRIWQEGWHAPELRTTDGRRVAVIYRGVWTHSDGPDFRDAMLEIGGTLKRGAVELHLKASDWYAHAHASSDAYATVALHVVLDDDLPGPVTNSAGAPVATVALSDFLVAPLDELAGRTGVIDLGTIGSGPCLPTVAGDRSEVVRAALRRKGWERLAEKRLRFSQALEMRTAADVAYRGLLDGLGLTANRQGMALVADALPIDVLESASSSEGRAVATALLLGVAGFLPLGPVEQEWAGVSPVDASQLDAHWSRLRMTWGLESVGLENWSLNRVRPANHPVTRLASLASLVAESGDGGLLGRLLDASATAPEGWGRWLKSARPVLGDARVRQIVTNVLAPFLAGYAEATSDDDLAQRAYASWEHLPGRVDDSVARATLLQIVGERRFPITQALEEQGLHQIGRFGCRELRCFECPIAELAMRFEPLHDR